MSFPVLYNQNETNFFHLGLGVLSDAIECVVTEERNGVFELNMKYPTTGIHFDLLENDRIIRCDAGHRQQSKYQRFRIKKITKSMDGIVEVHAQHVSYLSQDLAMLPNVHLTGTAQMALSQWSSQITDDNPFTVFSDINTNSSTTLSLKEVDNARRVLGGVEGSILDRWGGEYLFDNYHISLLNKRGSTANTLLAYGRNLTDLQQEENISNTFTSLYPFAVYHDEETDTERLVTVPNFIIDSEHVSKFPNRRILKIDFSEQFGHDEIPTPAKLEQLARAYITNNNVGVPRVSLSVSFVDLTKTLGYEGSSYEELNLCDEVPIYFEKLGIKTSAKIVRVEWDVLQDQYQRIEIGEPRASLSDRINNIQNSIDRHDREINNANHAIINAQGNTTFFGPDTPTASRAGDLWFRTNGELVELYIWRNGVWEYVPTGLTPEQEQQLEDLNTELEDLNDRLDNLEGIDLSGLPDKLERLDRELDEAQTAAENATIKAGQAQQEAQAALDRANTGVAQATANANRITTLDGAVIRVRDDLDNMEIGGRNLIRHTDLSEGVNTDFWIAWNARSQAPRRQVITLDSGEVIPFLEVHSQTGLGADLSFGAATGRNTSNERFSVIEGREYTLSFLIANHGNSRPDINYTWLIHDITGVPNQRLLTDNITNHHIYGKFTSPFPLNVHEYSITFTAGRTNPNARILFGSRTTRDFTGTNSRAVFYIANIRLTQGNQVVPWTPAPEDMATQSQVTLLSEQINLRVSKGDVINQINLSPEGILIAGNRIQITGQTFIQNAVIQDAHIANLNASKINAGFLAAARIQGGSITGTHIAANTITGNNIAANSIQTRHLIVSDMTNLAQANEHDATSLINGSIVNHSNQRWIQTGNLTTAQWAQIDFARPLTPTFRVGDQFNIRLTAFREGGTLTTVRFLVRYQYTDGWVNAAISQDINLTTTPTDYTVNVTIGTALDPNRTLQHIRFFFESSANVTGLWRARQVGIFRRNNGQMIIDGAISANHLTANSISTNHLQTNAIVTRHIATNAVTANEINVGSLSAISANIGNIMSGSITGVTVTSQQGNNIVQLSNGSVHMTWNAGGNVGTSLLSPETLRFRPTASTLPLAQGNIPANLEVQYRPEGIYRRVGAAGQLNNWTHYINFVDGNEGIRVFGRMTAGLHGGADGQTIGLSMNNSIVTSVSRLQFTHITGVNSGLWFANTPQNQRWNMFNANGNGNPGHEWLHLSGYRAPAHGTINNAQLLSFKVSGQAGGTTYETDRGSVRLASGNINVTSATNWNDRSHLMWCGQGIGVPQPGTVGYNWFYLWASNTGTVSVRSPGSATVRRPIDALNFNVVSLRSHKTNFKPMRALDESAVHLINRTELYEYDIKQEVESGIPHKNYGVIAEDAPIEIVTRDGGGVSLYAMSTYSWKAIQELSAENKELKKRLSRLEAIQREHLGGKE